MKTLWYVRASFGILIGTLVGCGFISGKILRNQAGSFAITSDFTTKTISLFQLSEPSGQLTLLGSVSTGSQGPNVIAVSPNGKFVFAPQSAAGSAIYGFSVDSTNLTLDPVAGSPIAGPGGSGQMAVFDPTGYYLFVSFTNPDALNAYAVDQNSGALTLLNSYPTGGAGSYFLAMDPLGRFLYLTNYTSSTISCWKVSSGVLTVIGTPCVAVGGSPISAVEDQQGKFLFVGEGASVKVYSIDPVAGTLTFAQGPYTPGGGMQWVGFDPSGKFVMTAAAGAGKGLSSYSFDSTGAMTPISLNVSGTGTSYETTVTDPLGGVVYSMSSASSVMNVYGLSSSGVLTFQGSTASPGHSFSMAAFLTSYLKSQ